MRRFVNINCTCVLILCAVSLAISVYPGALQTLQILLLLLSCMVAPVWIGLLVFTIIRSKRRADQATSTTPWTRITATALILVVAYAALKFYVPRRLVFPFNRSDFAAHVTHAPESDFGGEPLDQWLGIYHVDEYAKDPRGGVYFRTGTNWSLFNTVSWGFVYQPNSQGSPFGDNDYVIRSLGGGWYWFTANDDF